MSAGGKIKLKLGKRPNPATSASSGESRESAVDLTSSTESNGTDATPTDRNSAATSQQHAGNQQTTHSTASNRPTKEAVSGGGSGSAAEAVPSNIQPKVKAENASQQGTPIVKADDNSKPTGTLNTGRRPSSVLDYLISLGGTTLDQLYTDTFTSLTIFRSLPPLAKQYVLRLLLIDTLVPAPLLHSWVKVDSLAQSSHRMAEYRLKQLRILREGDPNKEGELKVKKEENGDGSAAAAAQRVRYYRLNRSFQRCIRNALFTQMDDPTLEGAEQPATQSTDDVTTHNGTDTTAATNGSPARHTISAEQLSTFAQNRWEAMLHFMVGAAAENSKPPADIQSRLVRMGFMTVQKQTVGKGKNSYTTDQHVITPVGFNFLFKDQSTQVWDLILSYIDTMSSDDDQMNRYEVLQFLFRLSFLRVGYRYDATALTTTQRKLLNDLHSFGLIYRNSPTSKRYAPTPLALTLSSAPTTAASQQTEAQKQQGFIVVETTFKMYAFTTSPFHMKLLSLFCRLDYRLPNMIVATITKESIRYALRNNISSNEIINYCEAYAHPQMKVQAPILPPTVVDQIRLWEKERERLKRTEAILVDDFDQLSTEFEQAVAEARKANGVLLVNEASKFLVVNQAGIDMIRSWRERLKAQQQSIQ